MSESAQAHDQRRAPEKVISVDLNQDDESKAVSRRTEFSTQVREDARGKGPQKKSPAEREMIKRMSRFERNMQRTFDQRMAERDAEHQRETSALRAELDALKLEQDDPTPDATEHERAMKALEDELAAANEKGDSAAAARITAKMIRTEGAYHAKLTGTKQRADKTGQAQADKGKGGEQRQTQQQGGQKPTAAGARFITANDDWWDDPDFQVEKDAASGIYVRLVRDQGYDANDDETFAEVAAQLRTKFPNLDVHTHGKRARTDAGPGDDDDEDEEVDGNREGNQRGARRAATGDFQDRGETGERQRSTRRVLTAQEKKTMRDVGMDPDNDKHVVRFLREAIAMES